MTTTLPDGSSSSAGSRLITLKDAEGAPAEGWQFVADNWYYIKPGNNGVAERSVTEEIGGRTYAFNDDATMKVGWHDKTGDGDWVWLNNSSNGHLGAMRSAEWVNDGANWYYAGSDGLLCSGWIWIDGQWYLLNSRHDGSFGRLLVGWQWDGEAWYYLSEADGHMLRNTVTPDGGRVGPSGRWAG